MSPRLFTIDAIESSSINVNAVESASAVAASSAMTVTRR
jgi:hypothetical protein